MQLMKNMPMWLTMKPSTLLPAWLAAFREQEWELFLKNGLPKQKDERFKYTDLNFLTSQEFHPANHANLDQLDKLIKEYFIKNTESITVVFINGFFVAALSDLTKLPTHAICCSMVDAITNQEQLLQKHWAKGHSHSHYPFANLNSAMFVDGLFLYLPDDCDVSLPVHMLSFNLQTKAITHPRHLFILGDNSKLTLVEEHVSLTSDTFFTNTVSEIMVGNFANLHYYKIQQENPKAIHMATTLVTQQKDSDTTFTQFSLGNAFSRDDLLVKLKQTGADCSTSGFYRLFNANQYHDHHVDIVHEAPCSKSEMLYKGVIGKKSRAVFNGRLQVEKQAKKIEAYQANHNLLLVSDAEVYSKPELEIYADDVKCKHGATTGQLDQEALFYLRSRGIAEEQAMEILLRGFAQEIIERAHHPAIKKHIKAIIGDSYAYRN